MPLPPGVDQKIRNRFEELLAEAERLAAISSRISNQSYDIDFAALQVNTQSLLQLLTTRRSQLKQLADEVRKLSPYQIEYLLGLLRGIKNDYESGMLDTLISMVEADVAGDYLGQAERLLREGKSGNYDHVPATVLLGAILEDALRRLCQRQSTPIPIKIGKSHKKVSTMIDDLKKAGVYNELKAKQLRAWADIRNAAAHGEFGNFTRSDTEQMLAGVQQFLADYL
jgi:hypothetical protein